MASDPADRTLVAFRMEKAGYEVVQAADGEKAVALALERRPALAIVDVMMPKADVRRGFGAGADDDIRKPFGPQELRARVQAIPGRR